MSGCLRLSGEYHIRDEELRDPSHPVHDDYPNRAKIPTLPPNLAGLAGVLPIPPTDGYGMGRPRRTVSEAVVQKWAFARVVQTSPLRLADRALPKE
jgi:hypothetical protein